MSVFQIIGIGLLLLGGLSGAALFIRAIAGSKDNSESTPTLWGLFIIGLIAGMIVIAAWG